MRSGRRAIGRQGAKLDIAGSSPTALDVAVALVEELVALRPPVVRRRRLAQLVEALLGTGLHHVACPGPAGRRGADPSGAAASLLLLLLGPGVVAAVRGCGRLLLSCAVVCGRAADPGFLQVALEGLADAGVGGDGEAGLVAPAEEVVDADGDDGEAGDDAEGDGDWGPGLVG